MKSTALSSVLLLSFTIFVSCSSAQISVNENSNIVQKVDVSSQNENTNVVPEKKENVYTNKDLGISFSYFSDEFVDKLKVVGNKIVYQYPNTKDEEYIQVFQKKESMTIEDSILDIVKKAGKDATQCKVVSKGEAWQNPKYTLYGLELADPTITYTKKELAEIKQADMDGTDGPFNGDYKKMEIANRRLIEACSFYADPLGLATCKTTPSVFMYNQKNAFVFLPGQACSPSFYGDKMELLDK